jgi:hypothetical protein
MIGGLLGILLVISYIATAWSGPGSGENLFDGGLIPGLVSISFIGLVGVFLFPRTVGMMFTPVVFATPIAFILALLRSGFDFALVIAGFGIAAWLVTFIIAKVRPGST